MGGGSPSTLQSRFGTSDYHLFGPLKNHLRGTKFSDDEAVKEICHEWLKSQPRDFYAKGILKNLYIDRKCVYQYTGIMLKNKFMNECLKSNTSLVTGKLSLLN